MRYRLIVGLASLVLLTGCSNVMDASLSPGMVENLCSSWRVVRPIKDRPGRPGDKLTEETAAVILGNNEARAAWGCLKYGT